MRVSRLALLVALGIDNAGSGFFLPLTLVYATRVVGLPLSTAGAVVTIGTVAGLLVPPVAGRLVDRVGPRLVVIAAQLAQGLGAGAFLVAGGIESVVVATLLLAAGQQLFYSSLFALISDVAGDGAKDRPFAVVAMVRSGCFGLGTLAGGALLTLAGSAGLRVAVAANAVSFLAGAALLATLVRATHRRRPPAGAGRLRADHRFLALIAVTALIVLSIDFFLAGMGVYVLDVLRGRPWLPGVVATGHLIGVPLATYGRGDPRRGGHLSRLFQAIAIAVPSSPVCWPAPAPAGHSSPTAGGSPPCCRNSSPPTTSAAASTGSSPATRPAARARPSRSSRWSAASSPTPARTPRGST